MKQQIQHLIERALVTVGIGGVVPVVEAPEEEGHGDYTTNVAMKIFGELRTQNSMTKFKNPLELAAAIKEAIIKDQTIANAGIVERVEVVPPGFINIFLSEASLINQVTEVLKLGEAYGRATPPLAGEASSVKRQASRKTKKAEKKGGQKATLIGQKGGKKSTEKPHEFSRAKSASMPSGLFGKKIVVEHTSPNTIKTLHLGHVRNNLLGMAVGRLLTSVGNTVVYDAINNDRGIHVMKANWAYLQYGKQGDTIALREPQKPWKELIAEWQTQGDWKHPEGKSDKFVDQFYILGVQAEEKYARAKTEMQEMLRAWEAKDVRVRSLWLTLRNWVFEGFLATYKRLGSHHDVQWFESDLYEEGKELVAEGLKADAFRKLPDGAVLTNLKDMGLSDSVALRADGTALYVTFDPVLTRHKRERYNADLYIWDIGPEQTLYLKQLFAICEKLGIGKRSDYFHLSYGFVYLKGKGKMSSRAGTVVSADDLMDILHQKARSLIKKETSLSDEQKESVAQAVGIGALKYSILRVGRTTDLYFDIEESLSLEGDSGPYLQYTYARARSVLRKAGDTGVKGVNASKASTHENNDAMTHGRNEAFLNPEERALARLLSQFPDVVGDAAANFAPNTICTYLFQLAGAFNLFYAKHPILGEPQRLTLTAATAQVLKNGLYLLGIEILEQM